VPSLFSFFLKDIITLIGRLSLGAFIFHKWPRILFSIRSHISSTVCFVVGVSFWEEEATAFSLLSSRCHGTPCVLRDFPFTPRELLLCRAFSGPGDDVTVRCSLFFPPRLRTLFFLPLSFKHALFRSFSDPRVGLVCFHRTLTIFPPFRPHPECWTSADLFAPGMSPLCCFSSIHSF